MDATEVTPIAVSLSRSLVPLNDLDGVEDFLQPFGMGIGQGEAEADLILPHDRLYSAREAGPDRHSAHRR